MAELSSNRFGRIAPFCLGIGAILAFLASGYLFLWAISSFNLAFADCGGLISLDAPTYRCQRAVWLSYAFWLFLAIGAVCTMSYFAVRSRKEDD